MIRTSSKTVNPALLYGQLRFQSASTATPSAAVDPSPKASSEIHVEQVGKVGFLSYTRPDKLNALNFALTAKSYPMLRKWQCQSSDVGAIVVRGAGGIFSAGGDIAEMVGKDPSAGMNLTRLGMTTYYTLIKSSKPHVCLLDGLTIGGGFSLPSCGTFRVATERTVFSAPETAIGYFTDASAHFLSRMPNNLGMYLALTGCKILGFDVFTTGLATHFCRSDLIPELESSLGQLEAPTKESVKKVLDDFHAKSISKESEPASAVKPNFDKIARSFEIDFTVEQIVENLKADGSPWAAKNLAILAHCSPLSLKITHRHIQLCKSTTIREAFNHDFRICARRIRDHDFVEGVKKAAIPSGGKRVRPNWKPARLEEATDSMVSKYFEPLKDAPYDVEAEYNKPIEVACKFVDYSKLPSHL